MRLLHFCLVLCLLVLAGALGRPAAGQTYNSTVSSFEGQNYILYSGTATLSAATANTYTQYFHVGDANQAEAYLKFQPSAAANVDVYLQCSNDRLSYDSLRVMLKDSIGVVRDGQDWVYDTLSTATGAPVVQFYANRWCRLLFDGQTGNSDTTIPWEAYLRKQAAVRGSAAVANRRQ
jgi:hypothetical protein